MSRIQFLSAVIMVSTMAAPLAGAETPAIPFNADSSESNAENIALRPLGSEKAGLRSGDSRSAASGPTLTTITGGLALSLGLFFLFVWVTKRNAPHGLAPLPKEAVESLGRMSLSGRQQLQLLRVGRKLVLLKVSGTDVATITEVVDPAEVDRLVGLCQQTRTNSVTASFREVLTHYEADPTARGFLGKADQSDWELANRGGRQQQSSRREDDDG